MGSTSLALEPFPPISQSPFPLDVTGSIFSEGKARSGNTWEKTKVACDKWRATRGGKKLGTMRKWVIERD